MPEKLYGTIALHCEPYNLKKWYGFGRVCRIGLGASVMLNVSIVYLRNIGIRPMLHLVIHSQICIAYFFA